MNTLCPSKQFGWRNIKLVNKDVLALVPKRFNTKWLQELLNLCRPWEVIRKIRMFDYDKFMKSPGQYYLLSWEEFDNRFTTVIDMTDDPTLEEFIIWMNDLDFPYAKWVRDWLRVDTVYLSHSTEYVERYNMIASEYKPYLRKHMGIIGTYDYKKYKL